MKKQHHKKRSKNHLDIPNFKLNKVKKIDITPTGRGLFLVAELIKKMEMSDKFVQLDIFVRKTISEAVHILTLIINQFTGGDALYDTQYVKADGALQAIFGDIYIPVPHTSGDFLERFTEQTTDKLRNIIWKMQEKYFWISSPAITYLPNRRVIKGCLNKFFQI